MDIRALGIPGIRVGKSGWVEVIETLPAWQGYLTKRWENGRVIDDGTTIIRFDCNERSTEEDWDTQVKAYRHLVDHQHEIRDIINAHVAANIDELICYLDPHEAFIPQIADPGFRVETDLRAFIGVRSINIREEIKDGVAYVEWSLNCTWDDEHGLAAVTHLSRLIDLDNGEIDIYKIFADNGTLEEELKLAEYYRNHPSKPIAPKPWWKFW